MKKKTSVIFIGLLLAITSIGSASGGCTYIFYFSCITTPCDLTSEYCIIKGPSLVRVGDIITVEIKGQACELEGWGFINYEHFEIISTDFAFLGGTSEEGCIANATYTLKALRPGTMSAYFACEENKLYLSITPKQLPMQQIAKIVGITGLTRE